MNVSREAFRDYTFPCAHNYFTCGGTDWFGKMQDLVPHYLRCQESSLFSCLSKQNEKEKEKKSIQHKALPNAEVNVLPQDNNVDVVTVVVVVCLLIA